MEEQTVEDRSLSTADIILYVSLVIAILLIVITIIAIVRYKQNKNRQAQTNDVQTVVPTLPPNSVVEQSTNVSDYDKQDVSNDDII